MEWGYIELHNFRIASIAMYCNWYLTLWKIVIAYFIPEFEGQSNSFAYGKQVELLGIIDFGTSHIIFHLGYYKIISNVWFCG